MVFAASTIIAGVGALAGVGSALIGSSGAKNAANAQVAAADKTAEVQQYIYDTTRSDNAYGRGIGNAALGKLAGLYGVSAPATTASVGGVSGNYGDFTSSAPTVNWGAYVYGNPDALANWNAIKNTGDGRRFGGDINAFGQYHYQADGSRRDLSPYTTAPPAPPAPPPPPDPTSTAPTDKYGGFETSPGYQFRLDQGIQAIQRSAAARGALGSGATMKSLNNYAQGQASSEYENYTNHLAGLAGIAQTSNNANAAAGANYANGVSAAYTNAGNATASGYINSANAITGGIGTALQTGLYAYGNNSGFGNNSLNRIGSSGVNVGGVGSQYDPANPMPGY